MSKEKKQKIKEYGKKYRQNLSEEDKKLKKEYMKEYNKIHSNNVLESIEALK